MRQTFIEGMCQITSTFLQHHSFVTYPYQSSSVWTMAIQCSLICAYQIVILTHYVCTAIPFNINKWMLTFAFCGREKRQKTLDFVFDAHVFCVFFRSNNAISTIISFKSFIVYALDLLISHFDYIHSHWADDQMITINMCHFPKMTCFSMKTSKDGSEIMRDFKFRNAFQQAWSGWYDLIQIRFFFCWQFECASQQRLFRTNYVHTSSQNHYKYKQQNRSLRKVEPRCGYVCIYFVRLCVCFWWRDSCHIDSSHIVHSLPMTPNVLLI